jgi:hypothetical protein
MCRNVEEHVAGMGEVGMLTIVTSKSTGRREEWVYNLTFQMGRACSQNGRIRNANNFNG